MNLKQFLASALCSTGLFTLGFAFAADKDVDSLLIGAQKICPVAGEKLGEHGAPIKKTVDGRTLFLCCESCENKPLVKEHFVTIAANQIVAQKKCPVMDKPLPKEAASTTVDGREIYVCCKPCIKKINADPSKYVQKVDRWLAEGQPK